MTKIEPVKTQEREDFVNRHGLFYIEGDETDQKDPNSDIIAPVGPQMGDGAFDAMLEDFDQEALSAAREATEQQTDESLPPPPEPQALCQPKKPGEDQVNQHTNTHFPYAVWCSTCQAAKARAVPQKATGR